MCLIRFTLCDLICLNLQIGFPGANAGDAGLIPGLGRCPGEENGNPLQEILESPAWKIAWTAWQAI